MGGRCASTTIRARTGLSPIEIDPGRIVPNNWDETGPHLLERWEDRKARRARERATAGRAA